MSEMRFPDPDRLRDKPIKGEEFIPDVRVYPPKRHEFQGETWEGAIVVGGVEIGIHANLHISDSLMVRGHVPVEEIRRRLYRELSHGFGKSLKDTFAARDDHRKRIEHLEDREKALTQEIRFLKVYINDRLRKKRWWRRN